MKGIKHSFAHTWEHCYAMQLTTRLDTYLYCFETEDIRIVCPISERVFEGYVDILTPYGVPGFVGNADYPGFMHHWLSYSKRKGYACAYIGLNPVFDNSTYYEPERPYRYNSVYVLDLTLSHAELFANLSKGRKGQLKDWDNTLHDVVSEKSLTAEFFLANYLDFVRRKNASSVYNFSRETLSFLAGLDNVLIVGARNAGRVEAVSVFAYTPHVGEYLFNVSLPEGRHHATALLWYGVNYLKSIQTPLLNLGGGVHENDGVAKFKQRFGSRRLPLKCLKLIYEPDIYRELCRRARVNPTDMTGYFPAYRSP